MCCAGQPPFRASPSAPADACLEPERPLPLRSKSFKASTPAEVGACLGLHLSGRSGGGGRGGLGPTQRGEVLIA